MKKLIVGNWKMHGSLEDAKNRVAGLVQGMVESCADWGEKCKIAVCPPFLHIGGVRRTLQGYPHIALGAQDCAAFDNGAYTGDVSAEMLADMGCSYVIVGHSERRRYHGESDSLIAQKAQHVLARDMVPIICVGETAQERAEGQAEQVVATQLAGSIPPLGAFQHVVVAYEPVWAIGTGQNATPEDVAAMHGFIRETLARTVPSAEKIKILYGGSMNPGNAAALLSTKNVDGGLVGGASLNPESFLALASAV